MKRARNEDLAWAAGYFDGEGCITAKIQRQSGRIYQYPYLQMTSTDLCHLERFQRIFGHGKILSNNDKRPRQNGAPRKPRWHFNVSNPDAIAEIMELMRPWLGKPKLDSWEAARAPIGRVG